MTKRLILLGSVIVLFAFTVSDFYFEALRYDPMSQISSKAAGTKAAGEVSARYAPGWSGDILDKNLFSPSRSGPKPPPPPPPPSPPPPPPPPRRPELALRGIVQNASGEHVAFIEVDRAKAVQMRKGEKIGDIEVSDLSDRKVMLQWMSEKITLSMESIKTIDNAQPGGGQITNPQRPAIRSRRALRRAPQESE
jgi:hypothetical protein